MSTPTVTGTPVDVKPVGLHYTSIASGTHSSYFVRSDGQVDRLRGGSKIAQRLAPPEKVKYVQASAGLVATYILRDDGQVDRCLGGSKLEVHSTLAPQGVPLGSVTYVAVSNSMGPVYILRSDGKVDLYKGGEFRQSLDGPYLQLSGGTDHSYHLKADASVDRIFSGGEAGHTFQSPADAKYVAVATQSVSGKNQHGAGGPTSVYFLRDDGKADRNGCMSSSINATMEPPPGIKYVAASCQDTSSYLLRSDGAVDRTTGGGKVSPKSRAVASRPVPSRPVSSRPVPPRPAPSRAIPSHPIPFHPVPSAVPSHPVPSHPSGEQHDEPASGPAVRRGQRGPDGQLPAALRRQGGPHHGRRQGVRDDRA